jgi:hypothetical protein
MGKANNLPHGVVEMKSALRHVDQDNSLPPEEKVLHAIMWCMGLSLYGIWTDFVPSEAWFCWGTYLSLAGATLLTIYVYWGYATGRMKMQEGISRLKKAFALLFLPVLIFILIWCPLVHALADFYTLAFGSQNNESVMLFKKLGSGRRSCEYHLEGEPLQRSFPDYVCISGKVFEALPAHPIEARLEGKISILGFHIREVYVSLNPAVQ